MAQETSPFDGRDLLRTDVSSSSPVDSIVFSGSGGNPAASAFISGFMRPGGTSEDEVNAGQLPSLFTSSPRAGDVTIDLTAPEKTFAQKNIGLLSTLAGLENRFGLAFWVVVAVVVYGVLFVVAKKK